jgi:beta-lactamase class D
VACVLVSIVVAALAQACSSSGQDLSGVVDTYLRDWTHHNYRGMAKLVIRPPANFLAFHRTLLPDLGARSAEYRAGAIHESGSEVTASLTNRFVIGAYGSWTAHGVLKLVNTGGAWKVVWSPQAVDSVLRSNDHLETRRAWPDRAPILGASGASLTQPTRIVTVGIEGSRIRDATALTSALEQGGATPAKVATAITTATAHPQWFVPVLTLPDAAYELLRPTLYPIPGTVFQTRAERQGVTPDLTAHLVGSVGPITGEELARLGPPYTATDIVGQTGIEGAYERQLAGAPGVSIDAVDPTGQVVSTLAARPPQPGTAVQTTVNPGIQQAAEQALAGVAQPAAMVAMKASTGEVLAAVSEPASQGFNAALAGQYPPGSTFKVVTSADLLEHGLTPSSPATCPPTITAGGQTFHNFEGEAAASLTLEQAFAQSCNDAFIGLSANLGNETFPATAQQFGLGTTPRIGLNAFGGRVPIPTSDAERAATAIGQGMVVASPLAMATVAAAVSSGSLHEPRLIAGAGDDTTPAQQVDPTVVAGLRTMMAAVVTSGTAAGAGLPPGTYGKTGTAEFGNANPPSTHAWFIGYRGDLAFAVLVVGGGVGGSVAAPIAAKFLAAASGIS